MYVFEYTPIDIKMPEIAPMCDRWCHSKTMAIYMVLTEGLLGAFPNLRVQIGDFSSLATATDSVPYRLSGRPSDKGKSQLEVWV